MLTIKTVLKRDAQEKAKGVAFKEVVPQEPQVGASQTGSGSKVQGPVAVASGSAQVKSVKTDRPTSSLAKLKMYSGQPPSFDINKVVQDLKVDIPLGTLLQVSPEVRRQLQWGLSPVRGNDQQLVGRGKERASQEMEMFINEASLRPGDKGKTLPKIVVMIDQEKFIAGIDGGSDKSFIKSSILMRIGYDFNQAHSLFRGIENSSLVTVRHIKGLVMRIEIFLCCTISR